MFGVPDEITDMKRRIRNGPEVKIDILDEGFWSPEVFRRYRVMTSMTERCFGSPGKCWGGFMGQGEGANQPTKGLCAPLTYSHVTRGFGAPHLGFPPPGLGAKSPKGEIPSALAAPPRAPPPLPSPYI